jgi:hypothetical protein
MLRAAVLFTSTLAFTGCVADSGGEGFVILNNTAVSGESCALTGDASQAFLAHGQINSSSPNGYLLTPLFESAISATSGMDLQRTILLAGANIELSVVAMTVTHADGSTTNPPLPTLTGTDQKFRVLFSGSLPPGGTANFAFEVLPVSTMHTIMAASGAGSGDSVNAEVTAKVTADGTMGGDRVDSSPFTYPITVCNDCVLVDRGPCADFMGTARTGNACNPFQDGPVDCCTDDAGALVCPAGM